MAQVGASQGRDWRAAVEDSVKVLQSLQFSPLVFLFGQQVAVMDVEGFLFYMVLIELGNETRVPWFFNTGAGVCFGLLWMCLKTLVFLPWNFSSVVEWRMVAKEYHCVQLCL